MARTERLSLSEHQVTGLTQDGPGVYMRLQVDKDMTPSLDLRYKKTLTKGKYAGTLRATSRGLSFNRAQWLQLRTMLDTVEHEAQERGLLAEKPATRRRRLTAPRRYGPVPEPPANRERGDRL
jgi:hypothetical protein